MQSPSLMVTVIGDTGEAEIAKRGRRQKSTSSPNYRPPRAALVHALPHRVRVVVASPLKVSPLRQIGRFVEDRRIWHPARWGRPVLGFRRAATRLVVAPKPMRDLSARIAFADPRRVLVCLRRKVRREVIHALGKGGGGNRRPRRKPTSEISC